MIRLIEEFSYNMLPALRTVYYDGWLLRFADGYTRRANSAQSLYYSVIPLEEKIDHCEKVYAAQGQRTIFKLTTGSQPDDLDRRLAERGYAVEAPSKVLLRSLENFEGDEDELSSTREQPDDEWIAQYCELAEYDPNHLPTMRKMLEQIIPPTVYKVLRLPDQTVACGVAVLERGYLGMIDIAVNPALREQGWGTRLVTSLLAWGKKRGATQAYLQVQGDNTAALRLYEKLGYREMYQYWYRVKDTR
jgi:ribosomal protein S18 acetylase RimI-like enzyme